jgi:transcriptional regulator with XRE-family HTH domain
MLYKIDLIIESASTDSIFGRIKFDDNLMVASAKNLEALNKKMKKLLKDFHQLKAESIEFEIQYDITGLFDSKNYLNASAVAEKAGISKGMMRQYTSGRKFPTFERVMQIQNTIHQLGKDLQQTKVALPKSSR